MRYKGNILEVTGLNLSISNGSGVPARILKDLSFNIRSGEILGLIGNSGSGKTITSLTIAGLLSEVATVDSGEILLDGEDLLKKTPQERRRLLGEKIGIIFQDPSSALDPLQTVGSNLNEVLSIRSDVVNKEERRERILNMLKTVGFDDPDEIYGRYPHRLSGGQRQRVLIAGAALMNPALLIADEPTSSLDTVTAMSIMQLLHEMCQEMGISILFISHNLDAVHDFCDRVVVMKEGTVIDSDTSWDIMGQPRSSYTAELLTNSRLDTRTLGIKPGFASEDAETVLTVSGLSASYGKGRILRKSTPPIISGIDMEIKEGECVGLIGSSGCGKTTLVKTLLGLIPASSGTVSSSRKLAAVFQDPVSSLNPAHSIRWHLKEALRCSGKPLRKEEELPAFKKVLNDVGLDEIHLSRFPHQLSGGQRQKVSIAMCLIAEPSVIIADEPFSALDSSSQASIIKTLSDINHERGTAMLIVTHNLRVVRAMCSKLIVMDSGRIVESGLTETILNDPKTEATRALIEADLYGV